MFGINQPCVSFVKTPEEWHILPSVKGRIFTQSQPLCFAWVSNVQSPRAPIRFHVATPVWQSMKVGFWFSLLKFLNRVFWGIFPGSVTTDSQFVMRQIQGLSALGGLICQQTATEPIIIQIQSDNYFKPITLWRSV